MRKPFRTVLLVTAVAAVAGAPAGCGDHSGAAGTGASRSPDAFTGLRLPPGVVAATAVPTNVPNNTVLRKDVTVSSCKTVENGWEASGTAGNPDKEQRDYTITIFFTTAAGTVIRARQTRVTVEPGKDQPWSVVGTFNAPDVRCVLRGVG